MICPRCGTETEYDAHFHMDGEDTIKWSARLYCPSCQSETEWIEREGWAVNRDIDLKLFDWKWK